MGYKDLHKIVWSNPHDEAHRPVIYQKYHVETLNKKRDERKELRHALFDINLTAIS